MFLSVFTYIIAENSVVYYLGTPYPLSFMKVVHYEKHYHYNDRDLLTVAKKVGKLATYCKRVKDESSMIRVDTEARKTQKATDSIKMTITVELPGKTLRAESRKKTVLECVDRCMEKLEPQVKKYKEKEVSKKKKPKK